MSALRQALGAEAAPHKFEHKGQVYLVQPITQEVKTAFSEWQWERACKVAFSMRAGMTPDEYERHLKKLNDDYLAGEYDFESERTAAILKTKAGVLALCALLWGCSQAQMITLAVERGAEVKALLELVMAESMPDMPKVPEGGDPNVQTPA